MKRVFVFILLLVSVCSSAKADDDLREEITLKRVGLAAEKRDSLGIAEEPPVLSPLRGIKNENGVLLWRLVFPYEYIFPETCELISVPSEFVTDLASIPAIARVRYNPADYAEAALVHDWLYALGVDGQRPKADKVFRELLIETGNTAQKAEELYRAVRAGGNSGYGLPNDYAFWDALAGTIISRDKKPVTPYKNASCDN